MKKTLAETKALQFESITDARAKVKELTDKMGIPGELGKENITAFNSADLNNIQSNMEQDSDYKDLLSAKKQQSSTIWDRYRNLLFYIWNKDRRSAGVCK